MAMRRASVCIISSLTAAVVVGVHVRTTNLFQCTKDMKELCTRVTTSHGPKQLNHEPLFEGEERDDENWNFDANMESAGRVFEIVKDAAEGGAYKMHFPLMYGVSPMLSEGPYDLDTKEAEDDMADDGDMVNMETRNRVVKFMEVAVSKSVEARARPDRLKELIQARAIAETKITLRISNYDSSQWKQRRAVLERRVGKLFELISDRKTKVGTECKEVRDPGMNFDHYAGRPEFWTVIKTFREIEQKEIYDDGGLRQGLALAETAFNMCIQYCGDGAAFRHADRAHEGKLFINRNLKKKVPIVLNKGIQDLFDKDNEYVPQINRLMSEFAGACDADEEDEDTISHGSTD